MIIKKLKNNTDHDLNILGKIVLSGEYFTLNYNRWMKAADDIQNGGVLSDQINTSKVVVNDGDSDLTIEDGIFHLLRFEVEAKLPDSIEINLIKHGSGKNSWMSECSSKLNSKATNVIVPFNCTVNYITFSNEEEDSELSVDILAYYKTSSQSGDVETSDSMEFSISSDDSQNVTKFYNNRAWAYDCRFSNITLNSDRRYAILIKNNQNNKKFKNVKVTLYLTKL